MTERLPASLAYLLIYNPTLPPPPNASKDDEDAQEEAHILFYTSRERAASRDRMLRQVGLAKALVNFSEIFTPGQGCDNVHSQAKRMASVSPEPDFWMHACIDLAKTPKPNKDKTKLPKGKDPSASAYVYHEDSLHDLALRRHLMRGYDRFKLLHGTFTFMLKEHGSEGLQRHLERFFTPWAWKWDVESVSEFGAHLGLPLHPLNPTLAPIINSFIKDIPPNATPLLLLPPYIIDPSQPSIAPYPPSLPAYLLSLIPPLDLPVPLQDPSKRPDPPKTARSPTRNGRVSAATTSNTLGFFTAAGAGMSEAMNVKKWSWPVALTFGKNGSASQSKQQEVVDPGDSGTQASAKKPDKPPDTLHVGSPAASPNAELEANNQATPDVLAPIEGGVDQHALDEAISSTNSPPHSDESLDAVDVTVELEVETTEQVETTANSGSALENQRRDSEASNPAPGTTSLKLQVPPTHGGHRFSVLKIFISEPSDPLVVQRRSVLHLSRSQLVLALLMDAGWLSDEADSTVKALGDKVFEFLDNVQQAIDTESSRTGDTTTNTKVVANGTKHIISPYQSIVSSSEGFSSTCSPFFGGEEILARDTDTIEIFSRTVTPQHWFVARRGLGFNKAGEKLQGEAYLETGNKEASLVDADNELGGVVRRWAQGED